MVFRPVLNAGLRVSVAALLATFALALLLAGCRKPPTMQLGVASVAANGLVRPLPSIVSEPLAGEVAKVAAFRRYDQFLAFEKRLGASNRLGDAIIIYEQVIKAGDKTGLAAARQVALLFQMNVSSMARRVLRTRLIQNPSNMAMRAVVATMMEPQARTVERLKDLLLFWRTALEQDPNFQTPSGEGPKQIRERIARLQASLDRVQRRALIPKPSTKPTSKPATKPTSKPTGKHATKPTSKPATKPTSNPSGSSRKPSGPSSKPGRGKGTSRPTSKPTTRGSSKR